MEIKSNKAECQHEDADPKAANNKNELHTDYPLSEKDEVKKAEKKTQESVKKNK